MKIMVVDDDPDVIFVLKRILKKYGCEVVGITDSKKCLAMVKKKMPDLLFLDVMMPDINGWEICRKIKEDPKTSDIFVSMLTVKCEGGDRKKSLEYARADRHLCKPINFEKIEKIVEGIGSSQTRLKINPQFTSCNSPQCS
ncbi:MAG: response regulator [Candidatus Hydrothermarchaeaceae archaeon]